MSCLSRVMCCRARTRAHLKLYQKPPLALNDTPPFAWGAFDQIMHKNINKKKIIKEMCVAIHFSLVFVCVCVHSLLNSSPNTRSLSVTRSLDFSSLVAAATRLDFASMCMEEGVGGVCIYASPQSTPLNLATGRR